MQATTIPCDLDDNLIWLVGGKMSHDVCDYAVSSFLSVCTHRELAMARGLGLDFNKPLIDWDAHSKKTRPHLQDGANVFDDLANRGNVDLLMRLLKMTDIYTLDSPEAKELIARAKRLKENWRDKLPRYNAGLCATSETINQREERWAKEKAEREAAAPPPKDNLWGEPLWFQALFGFAIYVAVIVGYIAFVEFVVLLWAIKLNILAVFVGAVIGLILMAFGFTAMVGFNVVWRKIKDDYAKLPKTWDFGYSAIRLAWREHVEAGE